MKPYQILMAVALLSSGALVLFGDRTPEGGIAEAVQRAPTAGKPAATTSGAVAAATPVATATVTASGAAAAPTPAAPAASVSGNAVAPRSASSGKGLPPVAILRLTPRSALVGESAEATFAAGEGIFQGHNWNPPPPPPPPVSNAPPPPPMAPPLPYTVIGKALADGAWEVYLARADKTYVARPQTIIDGSYRVEKITPPSMSITYLPLNQVQQINIGALD